MAETLRIEEEAEDGEEDEEKREERLLREQFPDFSKEYIDIVHKMERRDEELDDEDEWEEGEEGLKVDSSFSLSEDQVELMCEIHRMVFAMAGGEVDDRERRGAFGWGYEAASRMAPIIEGDLDHGELDMSSVGGNLMGVGLCTSLSKGVVWKVRGKPGFNEDPNPNEVVKGEAALSLKRRAGAKAGAKRQQNHSTAFLHK